MKTQTELKTAAINALLAQAGIDLTVTHCETENYPMAIPANMKSLFSKLWVEVTTNARFPTRTDVTWRYEHRYGSNGYTIGFIIAEEGRCGWRAEPGEVGYVY